jgi:hypothetical protein
VDFPRIHGRRGGRGSRSSRRQSQRERTRLGDVVGWVAYYTRGLTARDGLFNYLCSVLGVAIGMAAAAGIGLLAPVLGAAALPAVVLVVAMVVVSMRQAPGINNVLSYFLGLIGFFALHQNPSLTGFAALAGAMALGSTAAWLAQTVQRRIH